MQDFLKSGVNLQRIRINSHEDKLHTHEEDFRIATSISKDLGFELNRHPLNALCINYSLEDIINISFYTKLGFHKEMYFQYGKRFYPSFSIPGMGGEALRSYWNMKPTEFIRQNALQGQRYSKPLSQTIENAITQVLSNSCKYVSNKYSIPHWEAATDVLSLLYGEGRNRNHFGKESVENYFAGNYMITPLMDPVIRKLQLHDNCCSDNNLLVGLIFKRYAPELLNFPFEGKRNISKETLAYADLINGQYPLNSISKILKKPIKFSIPKRDSHHLIEAFNRNKRIKRGEPEKFIYSVFNSSSFRGLLDSYLNDEFWNKANQNAQKSKYFPLRHCYSVVAVAKVIEALINSHKKPNLSLWKFLNTYLENVPKYEGERQNFEFQTHFLLLFKKMKLKVGHLCNKVNLKLRK